MNTALFAWRNLLFIAVVTVIVVMMSKKFNLSFSQQVM